MNIQIKPQARKSLAMKATPAGVQVLIPRHLDAGSEQVQAFVAEGLDKLTPPLPVPDTERLSKDEILALVDAWVERLAVQVGRVQLQPMRQKWGSISTAGNLTLASDLVNLPRHLVEYVVCHELLHLKVPTHNRLYYLLLGRHIPDWREREQELGRWVLAIGDKR
ncbi:MAG: M48 family metallopeptidase [Anaerolineae bacterium]